MRLISVIIPTFRRPDLLPLAIESLLTQKLTSAQYEIIAIDNSPEGSAMPYLLNAKARCPVHMVVIHESRPGVAYARNTAFEAAKGELIAFLDDDTYGDEHWLQSLLDTRDKYNAAMVFGPTIMHANDAPEEHRAYIEKLFSRLGADEDKLINEFGGASCSLHVRSIVFTENPPFPEHTNTIGGEDDAVFHGAIKRGAKNRQSGIRLSPFVFLRSGRLLHDRDKRSRQLRRNRLAHDDRPGASRRARFDRRRGLGATLEEPRGIA